jgi:protocatechuate 3,4-dioxygenase beta subunit
MSDEPVRLITRRRSLQLLGGGGLLIAGAGSFGGAAFPGSSEANDYVAHAAAACTLTPEQEEGPYYVAVDTVRSDIIGGQKGLPFRLEITVVNAQTCKALKNAAVDVWYANAAGLYSDKGSQGTAGQTWLRGVQFTDAHGLATFHGIYPGHYQGRTTHVHVKVHTSGATDNNGKLAGGHVAHTGNLFSTDAVNAEVYKRSPYTADTAQIVPRAQDFVYKGQHGSQARMKMTKVASSLSKGVVGRITLGVNPNAAPTLIGIHS